MSFDLFYAYCTSLILTAISSLFCAIGFLADDDFNKAAFFVAVFIVCASVFAGLMGGALA